MQHMVGILIFLSKRNVRSVYGSSDGLAKNVEARGESAIIGVVLAEAQERP